MLFRSTLFLLLLASPLFAGIEFLKTNVSEALEISKEKNKPLMLSVHASWCGPCKFLNKSVYTDEEVGKFTLENFVNLKIDGEKGEGPEIMKKYKIIGYPTILLLKSNGEELDRIVGASKPEQFLASLEGFKTGSTYLSNYLAKLEANPNDIDLMLKIAEKYTDKGDTENAKEYFSEVVKKTENDGQKISASFELAMIDLKEDKTESVKKFADEFGKTELGISAGMRLASYFEKKKELDKAYETYSNVVEKNPRNTSALNALAWFSAENEMNLEKALEAAINAVEISEKSPQIIDTLAEVYFRMGKNKEAIEAIKMAIEKEPEDNYFKEQLEKFQKAQISSRR